MGQQQLLLLVLGIVIVGLAVVVGIQAFSENQKKANADSLVNDGIRLASDAQAWSLKPEAFGGPSSTEDLGDADFSALGVGTGTTGYSNTNGNFTIVPGGGEACIVIVGDNGLTGTKQNTVYISVRGTAQDNIETQINGTAVTACTAE